MVVFLSVVSDEWGSVDLDDQFVRRKDTRPVTVVVAPTAVRPVTMRAAAPTETAVPSVCPRAARHPRVDELVVDTSTIGTLRTSS